jgi:cytoskeletal protein CcmA (bactofilin family)
MEQRNVPVGSSVLIKGELSAKEDVIIAGRVEGSISVDGFLVTIQPGAHVAADVAARGVVVAGIVSGSVVAEERVELKPSAQVDGEIVAPRIAMAEGAVFRGKVDMPAAQKRTLAAVS